MQLVVPQEGVRARFLHAVGAVDVAVVDEPRNVEWRATVQVPARVAVNVFDLPRHISGAHYMVCLYLAGGRQQALTSRQW